MSRKEIDIAYKVEEELEKLESFDLVTWHTLHSGVYTRTIRLKAGECIVGGKIKIPTTLIISGDARIYIGDKVSVFSGYNVIVADKNRKQIMYTDTECNITMIFNTMSKTISEAEEEFTDEYEHLISRKKDSINNINIGVI